MENLFNDASEAIERCEYKTVLPVSELNLNKPNNYTVFQLDHGDSFYESNILYHIQGEVVKKSDGSTYDATTNIKLIDNFAAFLFSRIELKKHNTLIDSVDHVGICSTIKGTISYGKSQEETLTSSGFVSKFNGGGKFEALGTLGHLGLAFFDNLKYPMYKGGFEITFTRAEDNDALYHWKGPGASDTEPVDGKIVIKSFVLRVPLVDYNPVKRTQLIQGLHHLSEKEQLIYTYYQWQCIDKKGVSGSSYTFDITNLYRNVINPRFVIIGLQTSRTNDQKKDPSQFDAANIKNFTVKINGLRYPQESQNLDMTNKMYRLLYEYYQSFRRLHYGDNDVYLSLDEFIDKRPLMVVDTHYHPALTSDKTRNDIQIELDFTNPVASMVANEGTTAYVVVVSGTGFSYDIKKNIVKML